MDTVWNFFAAILVAPIELLVTIWQWMTFHSATGAIVVVLLGTVALVRLVTTSKGGDE